MGWLNKDLLPIKAHYFLFNAGTAPVQPFMTVFAKQLGFSSFVVGVIYGILPLIGMFSKLFIGAMADRHRKRKTMLVTFLVVGTVSFFAVQFVPSVKEVSVNKEDLHCEIETNLMICSEHTKDKCLVARVSSNKTIQCFFDCDTNAQLDKEICNSWNVSAFCNLPLPPTPTINELIPDTSRNFEKAPKLQFTAEVPMQHALQVGDCLFLRVQSATFSDGSKHVPECDNIVTTQCEVTCADGMINQLMRNVTTVSDVSSVYQFWLLFWLLVFSWMGMAVVVTLSDAICFELLGDRASLYGQQRLWGAIGWGLMAVLTGLIVDYFSEGFSEKNYTPAFYLLLIFWCADIACSSTIKDQQTKVSRSIWNDVGRLLINPRILVFMFSCIVVGLCTGLQWSFLYWYLEELAMEEGCGSVVWIKTLQGLVSLVQCILGELPYYFVSGLVLQRLGHIHCMSLILFFLAVRFLLYSALKDPWWTLPIELFQGVYGLFYPTMTSYANAVAPPGTEATVQGLVGAVFEGIGVAAGSVLAGTLYKEYSGATTFQIFGFIALLACVFHAVVQYILAKRSSVYTPKDFELDDVDTIIDYMSDDSQD